MAEDGQKMSKSLGNITSPQEVVEKNGADILRLWVVGSDYSEDLRIGPDIVRHHTDIYRRLRNTLRFLLVTWLALMRPRGCRWKICRSSTVGSFTVCRSWMAKFGRPVLIMNFIHCSRSCTRFARLIYRPSILISARMRFIASGMIWIKRRAVRTVLDEVFSCLTAWLAPFICFTAEEAWLARFPGDRRVFIFGYSQIYLRIGRMTRWPPNGRKSGNSGVW